MGGRVKGKRGKPGSFSPFPYNGCEVYCFVELRSCTVFNKAFGSRVCTAYQNKNLTFHGMWKTSLLLLREALIFPPSNNKFIPFPPPRRRGQGEVGRGLGG